MHKSHPIRTVVILLTVIALAALIGTASAQKSADTTPPKPVAVMESDNGKDIDLTTGQTLRVKLKTIAGTGYAWGLSGDPAPLKLTKSYTQQNNTRRVGGGQISVFDLSASSPGLANVTFVYRRSWEYNVQPAKTFTVRVNVR